jgi:hypothetical protein
MSRAATSRLFVPAVEERNRQLAVAVGGLRTYWTAAMLRQRLAEIALVWPERVRVTEFGRRNGCAYDTVMSVKDLERMRDGHMPPGAEALAVSVGNHPTHLCWNADGHFASERGDADAAPDFLLEFLEHPEMFLPCTLDIVYSSLFSRLPDLHAEALEHTPWLTTYNWRSGGLDSAVTSPVRAWTGDPHSWHAGWRAWDRIFGEIESNGHDVGVFCDGHDAMMCDGAINLAEARSSTTSLQLGLVLDERTRRSPGVRIGTCVVDPPFLRRRTEGTWELDKAEVRRTHDPDIALQDLLVEAVRRRFSDAAVYLSEIPHIELTARSEWTDVRLEQARSDMLNAGERCRAAVDRGVEWLSGIRRSARFTPALKHLTAIDELVGSRVLHGQYADGSAGDVNASMIRLAASLGFLIRDLRTIGVPMTGIGLGIAVGLPHDDIILSSAKAEAEVQRVIDKWFHGKPLSPVHLRGSKAATLATVADFAMGRRVFAAEPMSLQRSELH